MSPDQEIAAIFGEANGNVEKKRSRQCLSDDAKVDAAHVALEGLRVPQRLIRATITPLNINPDPIEGVVRVNSLLQMCR